MFQRLIFFERGGGVGGGGGDTTDPVNMHLLARVKIARVKIYDPCEELNHCLQGLGGTGKLV